MGVVESKKHNRKFELIVDLKKQIRVQLFQMLNWSFPQIKQLYDIYVRRSDCPFIDRFLFKKMFSIPQDTAEQIYDIFSEGDKYISIYELLCALILLSSNSLRRKLQFIFLIFDFRHAEKIQNKDLILIFQSCYFAYCRLTGQQKSKFEYLNKYTLQRFIRANTLEALEKTVNFRRLIDQVQGTDDIFGLFKRFDHQKYIFIKQEPYIFMLNNYKKYTNQQIGNMYRTITKAYSESNFEAVQMVEKNRIFRLQNRKISCIKKNIQEKEEMFSKFSSSQVKTRANSMSLLSTLPTSHQKFPTLAREPSNTQVNSPPIRKLSLVKQRQSEVKVPKQNLIFLKGQTLSKNEIFQTISYFKILSNNSKEIKIKEFFKTFQKKAFMKKQLSSLFKFLDKKKKGEISLNQFFRSFYPGLTQKQMKILNDWNDIYKNIYEPDSFDRVEIKKKMTKDLPKQTLQRITEIFNSIDQGNKGYLSFEDMKSAYCNGFTIKQIENMMKQFGKNNRIYLPQFIKMTLPEDWTIQNTNYVGV